MSKLEPDVVDANAMLEDILARYPTPPDDIRVRVNATERKAVSKHMQDRLRPRR